MPESVGVLEPGDGHFHDRGRPLHPRVRIDPSSPLTLEAQVAASRIASGAVSGAFRKLARRRGQIGRLLFGTGTRAPLPLALVDVDVTLCENGVTVTSKVATTAETGVEMEALVAASVAALTLYDMCKALDKGIEIREIVLQRKSGGKSGDYRRSKKSLLST